MSEAITRHVTIHGVVQGVGFRHWVSGAARDLGLAGWVRNRVEGSVEAVFRGPAEAVEAMIEGCRRGPPGARVEAVRVREATATEAAIDRGFEQRKTI